MSRTPSRPWHGRPQEGEAKPAPSLWQLGALAAAALGLGACAAPSYGVLDAPPTDDASLKRLYDPDRYHPTTRAVLQDLELINLARKDPRAATRQLWLVRAELEPETTHEAMALRLAAAEVLHDAAIRQGEAAENRSGTSASPTDFAGASLHLHAVQLSQTAWQTEPVTDQRTQEIQEALRALHDASTERAILPLWKPHTNFPATASLPGPDGPRLLRFAFRGLSGEDLSQLAELLPAERLDIPVMKGNKPQPGYGTPLVAWTAGPPEDGRPHPFYPPVGRGYPVTLALSFDRHDDWTSPATATFYEANRHATIDLNGSTVELAADRAAPSGVMQAHRRERSVGKGGMLRPSAYDKIEGLFLLDDYDPDKIPVVYVHGLMSSPSTWREAVIDLFEDAELRDHYQPLLYYYPTGYPIPANSIRLAARLKEFREFFDPSGQSPSMNQTVIVGHSMGGLLSSFQVRSLGAGYTDEAGQTQKLLDVPPDRIDALSAEERESLEFLLEHRANPAITRAIFVCVPHRGSDWASNPIGRLGASLVRFPGKALESVINLDSQALWAHTTTLGKAVLTEPDNGIGNLRPDSIVLGALLQQPIGDHVRYHSIIGDRGRDDPPEESSDGIVDYSSATLEGVESETLVPYGHVATNEEETVAEIRRILRFHLEDLGRLPAAPTKP